MQRAADDRHPGEIGRERAALLDVSRRKLERRVRKDHDVRIRLGAEPEPPRQIRVDDVKPARSETQLASLDVDEHLVALGDLAGQPRIHDARCAVHLDAGEAVELFQDGRDRAPPQAKRHRGRRRPARG
jgi:hypothetical protein